MASDGLPGRTSSDSDIEILGCRGFTPIVISDNDVEDVPPIEYMAVDVSDSSEDEVPPLEFMPVPKRSVVKLDVRPVHVANYTQASGSNAPAAISPIVVSSGDESLPPCTTGPAHATNSTGTIGSSVSASKSPIVISSGDESLPSLRTPINYVSDDDTPLAPLPGRYKGYKLLGLSDPVQPKRKNKTKKERDAAASGNTQPISTYFPSASGSRRVRLDRKLKRPVRTLPLSESSSSATFYPRVHRPEILITAPPRIRAPDSASAFSGGWRESRPIPLDVTDLWVGGTVAGPSQTSVLEDHHKCSICLQLKSHPVTARCGHSYCYTCIRISLEYKWECPKCRSIITQAPIKAFAEDDAIHSVYGDWDSTTIDYSWDGLVFPEPK